MEEGQAPWIYTSTGQLEGSVLPAKHMQSIVTHILSPLLWTLIVRFQSLSMTGLVTRAANMGNGRSCLS